MYSFIFQRASIIISSISVLSIFGANLDLGYLAENLINNYEVVRDFIWQPIELVVSIGESDKNICTFLGVFIPAFLYRSNEVGRIAAVSMLGLFVMSLALLFIIFSVIFINEITGLFEIVIMAWQYINERLLLIIFLSIIFLPVAIYLFSLVLSFSLTVYYWLIFFFFPHIPCFIYNFMAETDSSFQKESNSFLLIPYIIGYNILTLGKNVKLMRSEKVMEQSLKWMSWEETKVYYSPIKEVVVLAVALYVRIVVTSKI